MAVSKIQATKKKDSASATHEEVNKLKNVVNALTKEVASLKSQLTESKKNVVDNPDRDLTAVIKDWANRNNDQRLLKLLRRAGL